MAVVTTVSELADASTTDIQPLNEAIDADALDTVFGSRYGGRGGIDATVAFAYEGYWIEVSASGRGYVYESRPADAPRPPGGDDSPERTDAG